MPNVNEHAPREQTVTEAELEADPGRVVRLAAQVDRVVVVSEDARVRMVISRQPDEIDP